MKSGKIYFLRRNDGLVKVGFTTNLSSRLKSLTRSHGALEVIRVINGDRRREKRLHNELIRSNEYGEWFRDSSDLRAFIATLPDGSASEVAKSDAEKHWLEGETKMAEEAKAIVDRLIEARRQRTGCKNDPALKGLSQDYGISVWMLRNIHSGRASTVTAYTMKVLKEALPRELLAQRDELLRMVAELEASA